MKKIEITKLHLGEFMELIGSIDKVDNFISLRITPDSINSSVWFPDKDAVKKISLPVATFFELKKDIDSDVKMCFYNGSTVNSVLKRFVGPSPVSAVISVRSSEDGEFHADSITVKNDSLTIKITCSDPGSGFVELPAEAVSVVFDSSDAMYEFELLGSQKSKFDDLVSIDPEQTTFSIDAAAAGVHLSGSSYQYSVSEKELPVSGESTTHLFKKFLSVLDKDDYTVRVSSEKTFFESQQRDVQIVFANAES